MDRRHILDEIKRTAAANGGKPLGRLRFESETGIREYDWNKFWSRFADAQREAGLEPNIPTAAYDEAELLVRVVSLAREVSRFPTVRDMRVKSSADPTFPSITTFQTRFGLKRELVAKVAAYCRQHQEFADVLQWCKVEPENKEPSAKPTRSNDGFVYLIKSGRFYKIGKTNHAGRRERELAIALPEQARTVHTIKTDDPDGIEAYWHRRFDSKRKNGEWFELSSQDVSAFRRRKFM
jgi:hypothetical protein